MAHMAGKKPMTQEHKDALAVGRRQGAIVKRYLEALELSRPKRGRKRTEASVRNRLDQVNDAIENADAFKRLSLAQERIDLERELASMGQGIDMDSLESDFVTVAAAYGDSKGLTYAAWREAGVSSETLSKAGISRSR